MAVALGEQRYQHIGARHFLAARRLHVHRRALHDALEPGGRQRLARRLRDDALQPVVDELLEVAAQAVDIDTASLEHGRCVVVFRHRQQQMFERRIFMPTFTGQRECAVEGLLEVLGQHGHQTHPDLKKDCYSFSSVHCSGCWFLRA